jgi:hypothetical protein
MIFHGYAAARALRNVKFPGEGLPVRSLGCAQGRPAAGITAREPPLSNEDGPRADDRGAQSAGGKTVVAKTVVKKASREDGSAGCWATPAIGSACNVAAVAVAGGLPVVAVAAFAEDRRRSTPGVVARRELKNAHQMLCNSDTGLCE